MKKGMKTKINNVIGISSLLLSAALLSACDTPTRNQAAQQQHFICKSLIDGFLKAQHLGQYQLDNIQPTLISTASQRHYTYQVSSDSIAKLNMPKQNQLQFECQQNASHYSVELINANQNSKQMLMRLDLPETQTMEKLTAYSLETR